MSEASAGAIASVELAKIVKEPSLQIRRGGLNETNVRRLVAALRSGRAVNPIKIAVVSGRPYLIDGWHRTAALAVIGADTTEAIVLRCGSLREARWLAASANLDHGKQLTGREREDAFRAFIGARKHRVAGDWGGPTLLSYREIAPNIGASHTTIRRWMMKHYPAIAAAMGGDDDSPFTEPPEREPVGISEAAARKALQEAVQAIGRVRSKVGRERLAEDAKRHLEVLFGEDEWQVRDDPATPF